MMPFSTALQKTGGVELAAQGLLHIFGQAEPRLLLAALFGPTAIIGLFVSNTATAGLMAPIALTVAQDLGASPYPFMKTIALAASVAFMTPVSSPVNTLVLAPGRYRFEDFVRVGVPFTFIALLITVLLLYRGCCRCCSERKFWDYRTGALNLEGQRAQLLRSPTWFNRFLPELRSREPGNLLTDTMFGIRII